MILLQFVLSSYTLMYCDVITIFQELLFAIFDVPISMLVLLWFGRRGLFWRLKDVIDKVQFRDNLLQIK